MPAYKDKKTGKWYVQIYYQDKYGNNKQKKKRGFKTKREATMFEADFKRKHQGSLDMKFRDFAEKYLEDLDNTWKGITSKDRHSKFKHRIIPYFGDMPLCDITAMDIRDWHNTLRKENLAPTTLRKYHTTLSAMFNYAVQFHDLKENPCKKAGTIGTHDSKQFDIWTLEEYKEFISKVDNEAFRVAFNTLYFTGLRIGELVALTPADFDFSIPKLRVNKTLEVINKEEIITSPKTEQSNRDVFLPVALAEEIKEFINKHYDLNEDERIFKYRSESYRNKMRKVCLKHSLKRIRLHDLRHSHVSLLIELGYSPVLIAERLGHKDIKMTLNRYAHLYPNKQKELSEELNSLI